MGLGSKVVEVTPVDQQHSLRDRGTAEASGGVVRESDPVGGVLYLLDHLGGMDRIPVKLKDIGLENIIGLATFASMDSMTQQEYIARIMDEIDAKSQIRTALEEGRVEGREDAKADFVSAMRQQGFTEEQISSILGSLRN